MEDTVRRTATALAKKIDKERHIDSNDPLVAEFRLAMGEFSVNADYEEWAEFAIMLYDQVYKEQDEAERVDQILALHAAGGTQH